MPLSTTSGAGRNAQGNVDLRDYVRVVQRRKALIALIAGIVTLVSLGYSLTRTPIYQATSQVLLQKREIDAVIGNNTTIDENAIRSEMQLMGSAQMRRAIDQNLGYLPDPDFESAAATSPGVRISITNTNADQAAKEANDYAAAYLTERRSVIEADLNASIAETKSQIGALITEIADTREQIGIVTMEISQETDPGKTRVLQAQLDQLNAQVDESSIRERQRDLQDRLDQLNSALASVAGGGRYIIAEANVPENPISPRPTRDAGIALAAGILLGLAVAFIRDYFDDTLRTKEDLDAITGGLPVLGIIPAIDEWRDRKAALLEAVTHPNSAASEAYRSLRTSIDFISVDEKIDIIHVTSSTSGEGKSTTSANLAVTLARAGKRVILIDCDLRRPRLHQFFGMDNGIGFTSVVLGSTRIEDALEPVPGVPGLLVLPSGPPPPNPSELLSTKTVQSKLEALSRSADYVVIDSPPLLPVSDSVVIAGLADITLLVVTARTTARRSVVRSIEMLEQVHAPLGGVVFNGVGQEGTYGYGYGYGYTAYSPRAGRSDRGAPMPPDTSAANGASGTNGVFGTNGSADSNGHGYEPDEPTETSSTPASERR